MRLVPLVGLAWACLAGHAAATEDLLFYANMTGNEYKEATEVLNYTGGSTCLKLPGNRLP